jgi:serine/threonine protein phosphatase PrpC
MMGWKMLYITYILAVAFPLLVFGLMIYRYRLSIEPLPEKPPVVEIGEENAIGSIEVQEDAGGAVEKEWGILTVLADGIGKGQAGRNAALVAVRTFLQLFSSEDVTGNISYFFTQAFNQSNREILERLQGSKGGAGAAAVLISKGSLYYASVGDVKISLLRERELVSVNDGHTMKTAALRGYNNGVLDREQALAISKTDRQANYIGRDGFKNIEIGQEAIMLIPGDIIVLMTDGFHKCISCLEMETILNQPLLPQEMAEQMIETFNKNPMQNKDNASLFVLRYNGE